MMNTIRKLNMNETYITIICIHVTFIAFLVIGVILFHK